MMAQPQKQHQWLQKLVGEWTYEIEATMAPGEAPAKCSGAESVRSLGGLWILAEGQGGMPGGGTATAVMTLGYDPERQRYVGNFISSVMTHMWLYDGALDADQRLLTLDTEGPSFGGDGKTVKSKYQDVIEFKSDDHRLLTSRVLGEDGQWHEFMRAEYRRRA